MCNNIMNQTKMIVELAWLSENFNWEPTPKFYEHVERATQILRFFALRLLNTARELSNESATIQPIVTEYYATLKNII